MVVSYDDFIKKKKKKTETEELIDKYLSERQQDTSLTPSDYNDIAPVKKEKRTWFSSGAFEDGYDFGDVTKTILGTAGDIGVGVVKGAGKIAEGVGDLGVYGVAQVADWIGQDKWADERRKIASRSLIDEAFAPIDKVLDKNSLIGEKGDSISEGIGQVGAILLTGGLGASAGLGAAGTTALTTGTMGLSSMGSGMGEAYQSGATDGEAVVYGAIKGVGDAVTELIFGGLGKTIKAAGLSTGLSSADDMLAKKLSSKISNQIAKNFVEFGVKAGAEGTEEVLAGLISAAGKKLTYMSEEELGQIVQDENLLEQFIAGAVTSGFVQSGYVPGMTQGSLREANKTGRDFITGYTQSEQKAIDKEVAKRTEGKKLTKKEKVKIEADVIKAFEKGELSTKQEEIPKELKTYYHGTRGNFEAFDNSKIGQNYDNDWSSLGKGFYFTDNYDSAKEYGASSINDGEINVKEATLDIKKPFYADEMAQNDSKTLEEIKRKYNLSDDSLANGYNLIRNLKRNGYDSTKILKEYGYDGIIAKDEVMVFDANQIHLNKKTPSQNQENALKNEKTGQNDVINNPEMPTIVQNSTRETAYKYFGRDNGTINETLDILDSIKEKRSTSESSLNIVFDDSVSSNGIHQQIGNDRTIYINPKSNNYLEQILIHEFAHDVENSKAYKELKDYIQEIATKDGTYENARNSIEQAYRSFYETNGLDFSKVDMDVETTNDMLAKAIGNQEFLNTLAVEKPSLLQKIYNWFKNVLFDGKNTGKTLKERSQLNKIESMFRKAMNETYTRTQDGSRYAIESVAKFNQKEYNSANEITLPKNEYGKLSHIIDSDTNITPGLNKVILADKTYDIYYKGYNEFKVVDTYDTVDYDGGVDNDGINRNADNFDKGNETTRSGQGRSQFSYGEIENGRKARRNDGVSNVDTRQDSKQEYSDSKSTRNQKQELDNSSFFNTKYSLSEAPLTDNKGRTLTKVQQEFFKDSKVRDEKGNLLTVYHGSNSEFTIFDINKSGESNKTAKVGFWFTESRQGAENFADSTWYGENKPTTYETYLNIKNPKVYESKDNSQQIEEINKQIKNIEKERETLKNKYEYGKASFKFVETLKEVYRKPAETILQEKGYSESQIKEYMNDLNEYNNLYKEIKKLETERMDLHYGDSYEQFRTDIYRLANQTAEDANLGGIGMALNNQNEVMKQFRQNLIDEGYDGIVIKNTRFDTDTLGAGNNQYVAFYPEQIKNIDNTNPTSDPDIRYSINEKGEWQEYLDNNWDLAPTGTKTDMSQHFSEIVQEDIAPVKQELADLTSELKDTIKNTKKELKSLKTELKAVRNNVSNTLEEFKALTEADIPMVEQQNEEAFRNIDESYAPIETEENIPVEEDEMTATRSLEDVRDFDEVGSRKINAYQYDNPEVQPYFQEMARYMLGDLENSVKGERGYNDQLYYDTNGEQGFYGTTRQTTDDIAELLDGKYHYSYKDIRKGLEAIIEDHGAENIAVAKRIEFALDKRLREGYTDVSGYEIPANQEYIKLLQEKEIVDYYSNIPIGEAPVETVDIPVNNASNTKNKSEIAPVRRNIDWDSIEDTSQGNQIAINEEGETVEVISELEKKKQRAYKKLGSKEDYISNQAYELYDEVKNLKKGVKASYELGRVLDVAFANINALTEGMTETKAKEVRNKIWRDVTTSLLNVKAKPLTTVNKNSTIEAVIRQNIGRDYDSKKNDIANMKEEDLVTKTKKELRKELLIDENDFFVNALDNAKNRSMALMNNTDTIRNTELVFGRENAKVINEKIFQKEIDNEADSIAWQNKERQEIKDLGIKARSKESAAVQKYGEKQYLNEFEELVPYGDKELASEFSDVATQDKIKNAAKVIRGKYDNYIDRANEVLTSLGFEPIKKRNDYMRHFQELNDVFSRHGIPFNAQNMQEHVLPTDINGLTEFWSPQKNYFANMQARKGLKTNYDAITGVDGYIGGIANLIYHTEDIQRGRAFEELIRETYGEDKGFENLESLPEELQQARIEKIQNNHLSNYAAWVHEWTNNVAGKKSKIDRSVESMFGRKVFSFLDTTRKQVGSNMIGFNLSSSLTNLIAPVQATAKTNKLAVLKGTADTIKNMFVKDNFMEKNKFLTSRMGTDMISKNAWQKVQDAGFIFMKGMDWFSSNQIVRSKYYELRAKGMSEEQAHAEAGKFAARILGDRTKGANAQLYNSKLVGLVTQFQLEVNNQLYSQFYDTYHESKENAKGDALKTAAGMTFTLGQLFAFTHLFGQTFEAIAGYNPTFDVIEMLKTAFGWDDDEEEDKPLSERLKDAADQLVDALPYVNILTGGGRIPVASGIPNLVGVATGGKDQYGNELTFEDEMKKLLYLIPPTGGNQFKKTTQGLGMFDEDLPVTGSYTDSGNLRFPVEATPLNVLQSALFGQWANENARDYFDNERAPLKSKQIQEYADLDMPIKDYWKYREGLKEQDTIQEKFDYINSLDVTDEQKNIMINNAVTRKEEIDMSGYDGFGSYEEFDFATKNPDKYEVISKIDTYDNYIKYKDDIASIKEQFSEDNGYSTKERKAAVQQYIQSLSLDIPQKIMLEKMAGGYSIRSYENYMFQYIESLPMSAKEKQALHKQLFD